ncbi:S-adenosyl-L-methionine-dependent methyltransferase [Rhizophagus irregularis DAOM 181602=DAOM 197198]|uniref:Uncharacterized protein n=1 Tax=Rhizophagus irregularis (strain DAOM 181602 / DAOM 197198 / MUCL 43194) TaxID=747089 RepID=U9UMK2_RHIID|nr:S-adenosyl-L-methionine-dependent methyltransferase [Rhizophagus irregularis DAOM 181602=DAOM 197198]
MINGHINRIQLRHLIFRYKFFGPVEEKCENGSFILGVAPQFPNSKFYGIDMALMYPSPDDSRIPSNASFSH